MGDPVIELFQQQRTARNVLKFKIQPGGIAIRRTEHIDNTLPATFKTDAVEFTVARGFDIQRDPFQRRSIIRIRLQAGIDQRAVMPVALDPDRRCNKALHQIALRRTDIGLVDRYTIFAQ